MTNSSWSLRGIMLRASPDGTPASGQVPAPLLDVVHLSKRFPVGRGRVVNAVNDVSFRLDAGETLGIVGESGSGKTTVGRCVLGLIKPSAGEIRFRGLSIDGRKSTGVGEVRHQIQVVFQEPQDSLDPRWTVGQSIQEPLVHQGVLDARARRLRTREVMDLVRLEPLLYNSYPHQLSADQQQRVGLARALSTKPALVVLDEPTSALDIYVRARIIDLLRRIQEEIGVAYLFISHDMSAVKRISHRIAVMYLGFIVEVGQSDALFERQIHPYAKALLSSVLYPDPARPPTRFRLTGEIPSAIDLPKGCSLASRCPLALPSCWEMRPELAEVEPGRWSACHRSREIIEVGAMELLRREAHSRQVEAEPG